MSDTFTLAAGQLGAAPGDIQRNMARHVALIDAAAEAGADVLVFPEMSLTGYELERAASLALRPEDERLEVVRARARAHQMVVCVGAPIENGGGRPFIGLVACAPDGATHVYRKIHVTEREGRHCAPGAAPCVVDGRGERFGLAICADIGAPSHAEAARGLGATVYLASVLAGAGWYDEDAARLSGYAGRLGFACGMANLVGPSGPYVGCGGSAIWDEAGRLVARADGAATAVVVGIRSGTGWHGRVVVLDGGYGTQVSPR